MQFFDQLSQTALLIWVAESDYGYPIVLTSHAIGMALVVGLLLMMDLRILGVARGIDLAAMQKFYRVVWIGFGINLLSGSLLFLTNVPSYLQNTAFLVKVALLVLGAIGSIYLAKNVAAEIDASSNALVQCSQRTRLMAGGLLIIWLAAITAGRIVGYTLIPE